MVSVTCQKKRLRTDAIHSTQKGFILPHYCILDIYSRKLNTIEAFHSHITNPSAQNKQPGKLTFSIGCRMLHYHKANTVPSLQAMGFPDSAHQLDKVVWKEEVRAVLHLHGKGNKRWKKLNRLSKCLLKKSVMLKLHNLAHCKQTVRLVRLNECDQEGSISDQPQVFKTLLIRLCQWSRWNRKLAEATYCSEQEGTD